jgi:phosphoribosylformylglycinamidine synthase
MPHDFTSVLRSLLSSPSIASKRWVFEQYDSSVRTNNVILSEGDAAVVLVKESGKALAMKTDCNSRYAYLNPRRGGAIAVAEAARNVVCVGATPLAITNCLNFGNPYKPDVYWQFREAVRGIGEACRALGTPVTGGNVSFYNEGPTAAVYPTPVIGMIGLLQNISNATTCRFREHGDRIVLLGSTIGEIGGSEYLALLHGRVAGDAPQLDLDAEKRLHAACLQAISEGIVKSAHDCSEGGIAVALAESCLRAEDNPIGAEITLIHSGNRPDFLLFGEDQSRIILSVEADDLPRVLDISRMHKVPATEIGRVGGGRLKINRWIDIDCREVGELYSSVIASAMEASVT